MNKKLLFWAIIGFLIGIVLGGCTAQTPVTQLPTYTITYTDNSQIVLGNNNSAQSKPDTVNDQNVKPTATPKIENTTSNSWIYLTIITVAIIAFLFWLSYKKWGKWWKYIF